MARSVAIGPGLPCPKCHTVMVRHEHPPGWMPRADSGHYKTWDICPFCKPQHIQHYHKFYVPKEGSR